MPEVLLSLVRFSFRNRPHNQPVVLNDVLCLAGSGKMKATQAIDMPAAATHEDPQVAHAGGFVKMLVECLVGCGKGLEVFCFHQRLLLREKTLKSGDQARIRTKSQASDDFKLQRAPQKMRLMGQREIDRAYDGCVLRKNIDQAILLKPQERVADRGRAETELLLQGKPVQDGSRGEHERYDHLSEALEDLRRCLASAVKAIGNPA